MIPEYEAWIGKTEVFKEQLSEVNTKRLYHTLNITDSPPSSGKSVFPMALLILGESSVSPEEIGEDGHPKRGGFFPPIKLQRRMFAGERIVFHSPLKIGLPATRTGTIVNLEEKVGSKGPMILLSAHYQIKQDEVLCIEDTHNIVYLDYNDSTPAP